MSHFSTETLALNPSTIHRNVRVTRANDLIRVVAFDATVVASGSLTYLKDSFATHLSLLLKLLAIWIFVSYCHVKWVDISKEINNSTFAHGT